MCCQRQRNDIGICHKRRRTFLAGLTFVSHECFRAWATDGAHRLTLRNSKHSELLRYMNFMNGSVRFYSVNSQMIQKLENFIRFGRRVPIAAGLVVDRSNSMLTSCDAAAISVLWAKFSPVPMKR